MQTQNKAGDQTPISSEFSFLKTELEFLLKILRNCYSTSANVEKIKVMDSYWRGFEQNINHLSVLSKKVLENGKNNIAFEEEQLTKEFKEISAQVKVLKEKFYAFMHDCNACTLKTH